MQKSLIEAQERRLTALQKANPQVNTLKNIHKADTILNINKYRYIRNASGNWKKHHR